MKLADAQRNQSWDYQHWKVEKEIRKNLEQLEEQEQIIWMQKSRVNWILQGDRNTKFYHSITARRRLNNKIQGVWNEQRVWVDLHRDMASDFCNFYRKFFPPDVIQEELIKNRINGLNIPKLSPEQLEWLDKPFTAREIKEAAFQIGPFKSPGIDGKLGIFYQKYWHIVGDLTTTASLHFLNSGFLLKEINKTLVALVPKVEGPKWFLNLDL